MLLRGKHAQIDKVSGKNSVADCLTKHLSEADTRAHLQRTGFQKLDFPFELVTRFKVNSIPNIESAEALIQQNENRKQVRETADSLALAKLHLKDDI